MQRRSAIGLALLVLTLPGSGPAADSARRWTVMFYLGGDDSDLHSECNRVAQIASRVSLGPEVAIVVLEDRPAPDGAILTVLGAPSASAPPTSMGAVSVDQCSTLARLFDKALGVVPASHYALIVKGHGSGWKGLDLDPGVLDRFDAKSFGDCILSKFPSGVDVLVADSCNMGALEIIATLGREGSDLPALNVVAGASTVCSDQIDYKSILESLVAAKGAWTAEEMAKRVVQGYGTTSLDACAWNRQYDVLMAFRMQHARALIRAMNGASRGILEGLTQEQRGLLREELGLLRREWTSYFSSAWACSGGSPDEPCVAHDLGPLLAWWSLQTQADDVRRNADNARTALRAGTICAAGEPALADATGLSLYMPGGAFEQEQHESVLRDATLQDCIPLTNLLCTTDRALSEVMDVTFGDSGESVKIRVTVSGAQAIGGTALLSLRGSGIPSSLRVRRAETVRLASVGGVLEGILNLELDFADLGDERGAPLPSPFPNGSRERRLKARCLRNSPDAEGGHCERRLDPVSRSVGGRDSESVRAHRDRPYETDLCTYGAPRNKRSGSAPRQARR